MEDKSIEEMLGKDAAEEYTRLLKAGTRIFLEGDFKTSEQMIQAQYDAMYGLGLTDVPRETNHKDKETN